MQLKKTLTRVLGATVLLAASIGLVQAQAKPALTEIKISYQPALYWALPFFVATEKNWWGELGLKPEFSTFPAGVPQIAASASKSWDVGGTGSVPAVLGYVRFGIKTIGISNDESAGNALLATPKAAEAFATNPQSLKGQTIVLTGNSTGDYAVQSCLKKYGLAKTDVVIKNMGQGEIISAMSSGNADFGGLWAPNIYTLEEKAGAKVICSGKDGGAFVPGALIVRGDYAKENPQNVAKFLAVYMRAWKWMNANKPQAIVMMKKFYELGGVSISEASMKKEFDTRPNYDLATELKIMDSTKGLSQADVWFNSIAAFMQSTGAIQTVPAANEYLTDEFLKMVNADKKLREFANNSK
ncbi:ABC transporter substrate-binding protein [Polynucleobacter antarcticus]|uniref:Nitrate ABC transporter substrate-binding protein n=1 Tax=Polynucleobacter antarcticus TaxID=1743162 RepID=A0A6M9PV20_9BURK|nr:ABC transporter substrate-binding protein [Polynucleobacter antarcticus]QKM63712.1 nitrate ABC transporter substrate-binding protein [Polynucleobacter antarcticus]